MLPLHFLLIIHDQAQPSQPHSSENHPDSKYRKVQHNNFAPCDSKSPFLPPKIAPRIIAQVASNQYGGQSISLTHLAPFVQVSREKITKEVDDELNPRSSKSA